MSARVEFAVGDRVRSLVSGRVGEITREGDFPRAWRVKFDRSAYALHLSADNLALVDEPGADPDMVNHPPHYTSHPAGVECIDVVEHMPYNVGAAMKYLWRVGLKGDGAAAVEDLRKAAWYATREADRLERARTAEADAFLALSAKGAEEWAS